MYELCDHTKTVDYTNRVVQEQDFFNNLQSHVDNSFKT